MLRRMLAPFRHLLLVGGSCLAACSATTTRAPEPTDCNAGDAYELSMPIRQFESTGELWFPSADSTGTVAAPVSAPNTNCSGGSSGAGGTATAAGTGGGGTGGAAGSNRRVTLGITLEPIENGGRCGSQYAMVLRSTGHTDWGSLFGDWQIAAAPQNASGYEGIAIWARSGGGDPAFSLALDTFQTSASGSTPADAGLVCKIDCSAGSGTQSRDASGLITSQTYVSPPGSCGNSFQRIVQVSTSWQLYFLPFGSFYQELKPNAVTRMDPTHLNGLTIRTTKEADVELWIDDIYFYRRK